ncbi:MAG: ANTAR domain-containing protein, partial [Acidimicrobiales bacterium]
RDAGALAYLVKPFDRNDLVPQIEVALGRHREIIALSKEVKGLEQQIETRRIVDRAKGILMDECGMKEHDAFTWIQRTAMRGRRTMKEIAVQAIEDGLRPPE